MIKLFESNAGHLSLWVEGSKFYFTGVEEVDGATFAADAAALAKYDTDDWTLDVYPGRPGGELIALWDDGRLTVIKDSQGTPIAGVAGCRYLGLP